MIPAMQTGDETKMKNPNDRCLDGKERETERITVKRMGNSIKKIEFEIQINKNEVEKLNLDNEEKQIQISNLAERLEQGKRLINGAKVCDVFPDPNIKEAQEKKEKPKEKAKEESDVKAETVPE